MIILTVIISFVLGIFFGVIAEKFLFNSTKFTFKVNENKKPRESDNYWLLSDNGDDYMFTDSEITKAKLRANKNPEDTD